MKQSLLLVCLALAVPAYADVYRCVGADGATTFSQTPCSSSAEKVAVGSTTGAAGTADCEFAENFIRSTSRLMRQGVDKGRLFEQFGGSDAFDNGATRIVNYVYQYENTRSMSQDRIAELAVAQCRSGAFGAVSCASLPKSYTDSGGGCDGSFSPNSADYSVDVFAIHRDQAEERQKASQELYNQQVAELSASYANLEAGTQCQQKIQQQISQIESRIYAGADPNGHRTELKRLRDQMDKCGPARSQPTPPPAPGGYHRIRKGLEQ
jgi:hypothetical protein